MISLSDILNIRTDESDKVKIFKPWWNVFAEYLVLVLLTIAFLLGTLEITVGSFECLPAFDCNSTNQLGLEKKFSCGNFSKYYQYNELEALGMTTVVAKVGPSNPYSKFVNSECRKNAVNFFATYFIFILLFQAFILQIMSNFWLIKLAKTASVVGSFATLLLQCYRSPGTTAGLAKTLWFENKNSIGTDVEQGAPRSGSEELLDRTFNKRASVDITSANAILALYEKVRHFKKEHNSSKWLWWAFFFQICVQFISSVTTISYMGVMLYEKEYQLLNNVQCSPRNVTVKIPLEYEFFICSHNLTSLFFAASMSFLVVLSALVILYSIAFGFTILRRFKNDYDFAKEIKEFSFGNLAKAKNDLAFLLHLVHYYNSLYVVRFGYFMCELGKGDVKRFILTKQWPIDELRKHLQGNKLEMKDLEGLPETLLDVSDLRILKLSKCTLEEIDYTRVLRKLDSLSSLELDGCTFISFCKYNLKSKLKLEKLYLKDNKFVKPGPEPDPDPEVLSRVLTTILTDPRNLQVLNISNNSVKLITIPDSILNITSLEELCLNNNEIASIPAKISKLKNLENLDLSCNKLTTINERIKDVCQLKRFNLENNPYLASEALQTIIDLCKCSSHLQFFTVVGSTEGWSEERKWTVFEMRLKSLIRQDESSEVLDVIEYTTENASHIDRRESYEMVSQPKGLAVVIDATRSETNDLLSSCKKLKNVFEEIGFQTVIDVVNEPRNEQTEEPPTLHSLKQILSEHTRNDIATNSLVLVVISEGSDGNVPNEELVSTIASFNQYNEKPKVLFFISEQVTAGDIDKRDIPLHNKLRMTENTLLSSYCYPQRIGLPKCIDELSKVLAGGAYEWEMEDLVRFFYRSLGAEPNIQRNMPPNKKLYLLPKFFENVVE